MLEMLKTKNQQQIGLLENMEIYNNLRQKKEQQYMEQLL